MSVLTDRSSRLALPDTGWLGVQTPRFWTAPERHRGKTEGCPACANRDYTAGCGNYQSADLLDWARGFGYDLDPWQRWWLAVLCGTKPDGRWASFENYLVVSRQNGKNTALEVRELAGMFVFGESMIIHTAHEFKAAAEHFRRVRDAVTGYDELRRRVKSVTTSHGDEAIELRPATTLIFGSGGRRVRKTVTARLRFLARSRGSGRAFTADCVVYDEAMILSDEVVGASLPTLSAVPNPQVIYTASAGYRDSVQLASVRRRVVRQPAHRHLPAGRDPRPARQPVRGLRPARRPRRSADLGQGQPGARRPDQRRSRPGRDERHDHGHLRSRAAGRGRLARRRRGLGRHQRGSLGRLRGERPRRRGAPGRVLCRRRPGHDQRVDCLLLVPRRTGRDPPPGDRDPPRLPPGGHELDHPAAAGTAPHLAPGRHRHPPQRPGRRADRHRGERRHRGAEDVQRGRGRRVRLPGHHRAQAAGGWPAHPPGPGPGPRAVVLGGQRRDPRRRRRRPGLVPPRLGLRHHPGQRRYERAVG